MDASKLMGLMQQKKQDLAKRDRTVKPKDGKNRIALLPGWKAGSEHVWFHDYGQHYIKNQAGEVQAVYPCSDAIYGQPCPVCSALADATRNAPDDATVKRLQEARGGKRVLINALILDSDKPNDPVIFEIAPTAFGQLVNLVEEWGIDAFKREIIIERSGTGLNTKYTAQVSPREVAVSPATLTKLHDLDEYVKQTSEEQQRRAITAINAMVGIAAPVSGIGGVLLTSSVPALGSASSVAAHERDIVEGELVTDADDLDALLNDL